MDPMAAHLYSEMKGRTPTLDLVSVSAPLIGHPGKSAHVSMIKIKVERQADAWLADTKME